MKKKKKKKKNNIPNFNRSNPAGRIIQRVVCCSFYTPASAWFPSFIRAPAASVFGTGELEHNFPNEALVAVFFNYWPGLLATVGPDVSRDASWIQRRTNVVGWLRCAINRNLSSEKASRLGAASWREHPVLEGGFISPLSCSFAARIATRLDFLLLLL